MSLKNRLSSVELCRRLGVEEVADVVRRGQLRWFGHLERKNSDDWVSVCRDFVVVGPKSKNTWGECVRHDLHTLNLRAEWTQDRTEWRRRIGRNHPTCASTEQWTLNRI